MDIDTIRAVADAHGRAVRDGDSNRARSDVAAEFRDGAGVIAQLLPRPVTSYEVVNASVIDEIGVVQIRYSGDGTSVVVESEWVDRGQRPVMFAARTI